MPELKIPEKLEPFLFTPKRFKVAFGGRGGGKTKTISKILLYLAQTRGYKVGCFREYQNSIEDSVHSVLKGEINNMDLHGFQVNDKKIRYPASGGEFRFKGIKHNTDSVKSFNGFNIFWYEESQALSANTLKDVVPTLREEGSEHWFSLNLQSGADPIARRFFKPYEKQLRKYGFYEDELHYITWINYDDNPWFPTVMELDRQLDKEMMTTALYNHVWLGHTNDSVENAIIPEAWFNAAIDSHLKLGWEGQGARVCAHDPSDTGPDSKGVGIRHGSLIEDIRENSEGDVNQGCDWATDYAIGRDADLFTWDCDGMGISLQRQVAAAFHGKKLDYVMFRGSEGVDDPKAIFENCGETSKKRSRTNREAILNKRAQYYWKLRNRFYKTYQAVVLKKYTDPNEMISLSSEIEDMEQLRSEVCRIPLKPNGNGVIQILTKLEMKTKLKIDSPNMSDTLMMLMIDPEVETFTEDEPAPWDPFDSSMNY